MSAGAPVTGLPVDDAGNLRTPVCNLQRSEMHGKAADDGDAMNTVSCSVHSSSSSRSMRALQVGSDGKPHDKHQPLVPSI